MSRHGDILHTVLGLMASTPTALMSHKRPLGRRRSKSSSQAVCKRREARILQPFQQKEELLLDSTSEGKYGGLNEEKLILVPILVPNCRWC